MINNLISNVNILDIVSKFLIVKKIGNGFFAKCPFHKENTASFYLDIRIQKYYCFGCHKHGNSIDFIINYKKCNFKDAVKIIRLNLNKLDISLKYSQTDVCYYNYENILNNFNYLLKKSFLNKNKLFYFLKKRNIKYNSVKYFNLGFVPNYILYKFKFLKNLITLGFFKKDNIDFNRFRNRIIFPIKNIKGKIIGIGARSLYDNIKPKYINSPESEFFSKKKELYGLYESLKNKKNYLIIVEGYFDVITLYQNDIKNAAAILGTAFSKEHLLVLKNFYKEIIFCYDGDRAGRLASLRTAYLCLPFILDFDNIKFIIMPNCVDPDSFFKNRKKSDFLNFIKNAVFILDFIFLSMNLYKNEIELLKKINKVIKNIDNILIKNFIINYFNELIYKRKIIISKKENYISSIYIKACLILLKERSLINKINILNIINNKNISFKSDIIIFLDLIFLLKNNIKLSYSEINKRLIRKINIKSFNYLLFLKKIPKETLENDFIEIVNKISKN